jgi:aerobic C4-dicarboxylate transport protein
MVMSSDRAIDRRETSQNPSLPVHRGPVTLHRSLYAWVVVAIVLGVSLGVSAPGLAVEMEPLATGFIKLVKMTIAPLVFCTVVVGIASMQSMRAVGTVGGLAIVYFEAASTLALAIGLVVVNVVRPGDGVTAPADASAVAQYTHAPMKSVTEFLLDVIPDTFFGALARGELLPVLVVAILFGFALHGLGERGKPLLALVDSAGHVVFGIVAIIMKAAPLGAFGAMAYTIGKYGAGTLVQLGQLMACFYGTCLVFIFGVLGLVARLHGFSILRYLRYIADELFVVLGTSSSESVLPRMMTKLERLGASKPVVGLVIPAGYSFNLDGTSIYLTIAAVFVAQATHTPLDLGHQLSLLGVLLLTSKGAAGVTGSGFIVLSATLGAVGDVPVAGLSIILGVDRFMSEARAITNVIGNGVATLVVAKWCGERDDDKLRAELHARGATHMEHQKQQESR